MNTVKFPDGSTLEIEPWTTGKDLIKYFNTTEKSVVAIKINNEICSLSQNIDINANVEPVLMASKEGSAIYRRSLCFVLAAAAHELYPNKRLLVGHSLGYGYYYTLDTGKPICKDDISKLQSKMKELISKDLPIVQDVISYEDAIKLFERQNLPQTRNQLAFMSPPKITVNTLNGFSDLYYAPLFVSTGLLDIFEIKAYGDGFLLRFPPTTHTDHLTEFQDFPKLFAVYKRYKEWGKTLGVTSAASLNELVHNRKAKEFIDITELLQEKNIAEIADMIYSRKNVKMVLMAGPSSSGKTTSSKKLAMQLQVLGYKPKVVELDTYYVGRESTPRDENGDYDYECLEALDINLLNENLVDLFNGQEVKMPSYDFVEGKRYYTGRTLKLEENDILVMEGIHGLNDKLTPLIPNENKFKIYLSALTQLNLDDHNRIPTSDNRLIRRIVRDAQFRGKSAADTISMWPSVQKGERLHIFPFQSNADAMLNTALDYEIAVLKTFAEPLLRCVTPLQKEYSEAARLLRFLNNFSPIPANLVPGKSLIREFIGGSEFKY